MVKIELKIETVLDIYPKKKLAILCIQDQELSNYVFEEYIHYPDGTTVSFFGVDGKDTSTVKYDCVRIW